MVSDQRFPFGEMKEFIVLLDIAEAQLSGLPSLVVTVEILPKRGHKLCMHMFALQYLADMSISVRYGR